MSERRPHRGKKPKTDGEFDEKDGKFRAWLQEVSRLCQARYGLALSDLPDLRTRGAFDEEVSPQEFFEEEVKEMMREEFGSLADDDR